MTFIPKSFTSGATLPALSLNEMDANDDHVREEAAYKHLAFVAEKDFSEGTGYVSPLSVQCSLDGTPISTATTSTGAFNRADIDISALTPGIHYLSVKGLLIRFYKSPDINYITWWTTIVTITTGSPSESWIFELRNFTLIGHREAKSWT